MAGDIGRPAGGARSGPHAHEGSRALGDGAHSRAPRRSRATPEGWGCHSRDIRAAAASVLQGGDLLLLALVRLAHLLLVRERLLLLQGLELRSPHAALVVEALELVQRQGLAQPSAHTRPASPNGALPNVGARTHRS